MKSKLKLAVIKNTYLWNVLRTNHATRHEIKVNMYSSSANILLSTAITPLIIWPSTIGNIFLNIWTYDETSTCNVKVIEKQKNKLLVAWLNFVFHSKTKANFKQKKTVWATGCSFGITQYYTLIWMKWKFFLGC